MLTFNELRAAIVMMKRAPLKGDEALIVAQTIMKLEAIADTMLNKTEAKSDDQRTT